MSRAVEMSCIYAQHVISCSSQVWHLMGKPMKFKLCLGIALALTAICGREPRK
jgi:hypothetical protein